MKIITYRQAQEYLESFIRPSVFERIKEDSHMQDPLDRMRVLLSLLGDPQKKFKSVQISGTSGKGSTSYLLNNILVRAGYKTGLATSPHLERMTERMLINNLEIDEKKFVALVQLLIPAIEKMKKLSEGEPSYFELLTALAFLHFTKEKVDIAVVEVGLEGKYDATNVLDPLVIIITNISKDHTELLGDTEQAIAGEVLSIVRNGETTSPIIVTGIMQDKLRKMVRERADDNGLVCKAFTDEFKITSIQSLDGGVEFDYEGKDLHLSKIYVSMRGEYQAVNAGLAVAATTSLKELGFTILDEHVRGGLSNAFFAGRFEVFTYVHGATSYTYILDGAHNDAKMGAFLKALDHHYPDQAITYIVGFKKNKDSTAMLRQLFSRKGTYILTQFHKGADYARSVSMTTSELKMNADDAEKTFFMEDVPSALNQAVQLSGKVIVVTGSLYLVGEVRSILMPRELCS